MAKTFLTNLNLVQNQLLNAVIQPLASAPSSPLQGQVYFDTTLNEFGVYTGSGGWLYLTSATGSVAEVTAGNATITVGGTQTNPTIEVTAGGLTHTYISDFDDQVNTHSLDELTPAAGNYSMGGNKLTNLEAGSASSDSATFGQIPTTLPPTGAAGGDLTGNYPDPTLANTANVDAIITGYRLDEFAAPEDSVSFGGQQITDLADPTSPQMAATKNYVDATSQGLDVKPSVAAATVGPLPTNTYTDGVLTASSNGALGTIDGVTLVVGDRVLVQDEVTEANNGIYVITSMGSSASAWVFTRSSDMSTGADVPGAFVFVESGTVNGSAGFVVSGVGPFTLGTTAITFTQFSGAGEIEVSGGLAKDGNVISIVSGGLPVDDGGTGSTTPSGAKTNLGFTTKYAVTFGDGSTTTYTITHNLDTQDVSVTVYDANVYSEVEVDVIHATVNTVTLGFATAPAVNAYRVVVIG